MNGLQPEQGGGQAFCKKPTSGSPFLHFITGILPLVQFCFCLPKIIFKLAVTFPGLVSSHQKTADMQKKYWVIPVIITATLVASLFALSSPKTATTDSKPTCCKKITKECPVKMQEARPEQSSLDNLSNQFISFPVY